MSADDRVAFLAREKKVHGGAVALVGADNPFFRAIREAAVKADVDVVDGFRATMPVVVDSDCNMKHVLTDANDVDNLNTDGMSCVAEATFELLQTYGLTGKHVVIVGRGHATDGLASALLAENATVTVCHSKTRYLASIMQSADMLVVAAPVKETIKPRESAVIVDVSSTYADREEWFKDVCDYTRHIGKLTVAVLLDRVSKWWSRS